MYVDLCNTARATSELQRLSAAAYFQFCDGIAAACDTDSDFVAVVVSNSGTYFVKSHCYFYVRRIGDSRFTVFDLLT